MVTHLFDSDGFGSWLAFGTARIYANGGNRSYALCYQMVTAVFLYGAASYGFRGSDRRASHRRVFDFGIVDATKMRVGCWPFDLRERRG
jgi:hypothetical protein